MTDVEIARNAKLKKIEKISKHLGFRSKIECFGKYKAKLPLKYGKKQGKVILVTSISPTKMGNGKTTVSIGLADALSILKKRVCLALREPSLGPVFGVKGGATGGGKSQIVPMEDINLNFNGDFSAITSANNLLCALIDNHIFQGNQLNIDENRILFGRCMDMNDRALRHIEIAIGEKDGIKRNDGFVITAASEIMAILCLSSDLMDLKRRLGNIAVAYDKNGNLIFAKQLNAPEAMAILLKDAIKPNLVQTLEGTPCIVHGGPFANIAHGCNSIIATKMAMSYADFVVTEAGFGSDLGAEKFFDIKCRVGNINPSAIVLVATLSALKLHGGANEDGLKQVNFSAIEKGLENLYAHIENLKNNFNMPVIVTLNKYQTDTQEELEFVTQKLKNIDVDCVTNDVWAKGGKGAISLARAVVKNIDDNLDNKLTFCYKTEDTLSEKLNKIAKKVYGADGVVLSDLAQQKLDDLQKSFGDFPICFAKTQYSLSDNKDLLGRPKNFKIHISDLQLKTGAEFIVAIAGNILLMPGLPKVPNAVNMTIDENQNIDGLF